MKAHVGFDTWAQAGLSICNYLGEVKMVKLREINAATNQIDYYTDKK